MEANIPGHALAMAVETYRSWTDTYQWITIAGGIVSFALAFMAGANDIPIAFGTSVGSGTLTLRQSVILTFVMEIVGAILLGNHSIDAIDLFILKERPSNELMMWGFMIAMIAAAIWLTLANCLEMPVTSTLSIQGAILGVALTVQGWHEIYWSKYDSGSVLHAGGLTGIFLSWVMAPLIALVGAFSFFSLTKVMLLCPYGTDRRKLWMLPSLYGLSVTVFILFIFYWGTPATSLHDMPFGKAAVIAASAAVLSVLITYLVLVWLNRKQASLLDFSSTTRQHDKVMSDVQENGWQETGGAEERKELSPEELLKQFNELRVLHTVYEGDEEEAMDESPQAHVKCSPVCGHGVPLKQLLSGTPNRFPFQKLEEPKKITTRQRIVKFACKSREYTFDHKIEYGQKTIAHHALAEKFDQKVEEPFCFLLILTASLLAIAHGSNNVPYLMGPFAGILHIFRSHRTEATRGILDTWKLDVWVRLLGGVGASMGYGVWGWKIVRSLGGRLTFLSPSRAFSAQLCTLATIVLSTKIKLPVSTAHTLIGAILGVSIADSIKNTNWHLLGIFILMWGLTLVLTCGIASGLYAFTIFSPSVSVMD